MKRIIIRIISLALIICLFVSAGTTQASFDMKALKGQAYDCESRLTLDATDIWLITGNQIICEMNNDDCKWNERTYIINTIPLYSFNDNVIAYYIALSDGGYMVINNNKLNPVVIEFSYSLEIIGDRDIDDSINKYHYFGPGMFAYCKTDQMGIEFISPESGERINCDDALEASKLFDTIMATPNNLKSCQLEKFRQYIDNTIQSSGDLDTDYGFFNLNGLPTSTTTGNDWIPLSRSLNHYGTTGEFYGLLANYTLLGQPVYVTNHCVAVSAFNMLYYYRNIMSNPFALVDRQDIFLDIHSYIKNGPVTPDAYGSRFESYIEDNTNFSYTYWLHTSNTWSNYTATITADHMAFIVSWPTLTSAHTFNGIGYMTYSTSEKYCRIIDGWNNTPDRFYLWATGLFALGYITIN